MALGTWKEGPKENAILQESYADLGGNADNLTRDQKLRKAEQAHVIAGKTKVANEQKKGSDSHDSSIYLSYFLIC